MVGMAQPVDTADITAVIFSDSQRLKGRHFKNEMYNWPGI
jgi:hypothetical protein